MKKIRLFLFMLLVMIPLNVNASNKMYDSDINENMTWNVSEIFQVQKKCYEINCDSSEENLSFKKIDVDKNTFILKFSKISFFDFKNCLNIILQYTLILFIGFLPLVFFCLILNIILKMKGYGYFNNKKIDKKNTVLFRDIPCNKDIYYANTLIKLNGFDYDNTNILGAILLKWIKNKKITFKTIKTGLFNMDTSVIDLTMNPVFDNENERELFNVMYKASKDGYLETKEFERWIKRNDTEFINLFDKFNKKNIEDLKVSGHIYKRKNRKECKSKNIMDDVIYNDSVQLYGLKKYLEEFSNIGTKEVMDVHLWDEYLMFAYLFGIADKVAAQLKNMYPEVIGQMKKSNFDYDMIELVNDITIRSVKATTSSIDNSYYGGNSRSSRSSFSRGGGGRGSFGGGRGSMGGR